MQRRASIAESALGLSGRRLTDEASTTPRRERRRHRERNSAGRGIGREAIDGLLSFVSPAALALVAYASLVLFLGSYWWGLSSSVVSAQQKLNSYTGNVKLQELERAELLKLLLERLHDDYSFILDEAETALKMDNVSYNPGATNFAYNTLLPQLYAGLELINNISKGCKEDPEHYILLHLASGNPSGIGSPEWTFKHDAKIRNILGQPLRHASSTLPFEKDTAKNHGALMSPVDRLLDYLGQPKQQASPVSAPSPSSEHLEHSSNNIRISHLRYVLIFLLLLILITRAI